MSKSIYEASREGDVATVREILSKNRFFVNLKHANGWTPLLCAAFGGHSAVVQLLLEDPEINLNIQTREGETPVIVAASRGHIDVVRILVESGADLSIADKHGTTALIAASTPDIRDFLLQAPKK